MTEELPRLALAAALAVLAGCSTAPDFFHTLRPSGAAAATPPASRGSARTLAVGPVTVPDALARDGWVIRVGETGVQVHEHQLWTQGLQGEIAQALVDQLNHGPLPEAMWADAGPTGSGAGTDLDVPASLRVRVQVLRFDSLLAPEPAVADQLRWTIECLPADNALAPIDAARYRVVRGGVREVSQPAPPADPSVDSGQQRYDRLARAHADALRVTAADIDAALRASAAERARDCGR